MGSPARLKYAPRSSNHRETIINHFRESESRPWAITMFSACKRRKISAFTHRNLTDQYAFRDITSCSTSMPKMAGIVAETQLLATVKLSGSDPVDFLIVSMHLMHRRSSGCCCLRCHLGIRKPVAFTPYSPTHARTCHQWCA